MKNIKLSATIITFNEQENIGRCLQSLIDVADEIIVVDSYSEDRTEEICQSHAVKFIQHKFAGHIEQKNYALDQTSFDYILSLDADEVLSDQLIKSILEIKRQWSADAYQFNRLNNFCGKWIKHGLWYPDRKIRIWDKRKGRWGGENPHDKVEMQASTQVQHLSGDLLHYTVTDLNSFYVQLDKFSSIQAKGLKRGGLKPNFYHFYLKPLYKFILGYIIRLGFLDGREGYQIAKGQSWSVRERYRKVASDL